MKLLPQYTLPLDLPFVTKEYLHFATYILMQMTSIKTCKRLSFRQNDMHFMELSKERAQSIKNKFLALGILCETFLFLVCTQFRPGQYDSLKSSTTNLTG